MSLISWLKGLFTPQAAPKQQPLGRNDVCWCGSGQKYKRCHLKDDEKGRYEEAHAARVASSRTPPGGGRRPPRPQETAQLPRERG